MNPGERRDKPDKSQRCAANVCWARNRAFTSTTSTTATRLMMMKMGLFGRRPPAVAPPASHRIPAADTTYYWPCWPARHLLLLLLLTGHFHFNEVGEEDPRWKKVGGSMPSIPQSTLCTAAAANHAIKIAEFSSSQSNSLLSLSIAQMRAQLGTNFLLSLNKRKRPADDGLIILAVDGWGSTNPNLSLLDCSILKQTPSQLPNNLFSIHPRVPGFLHRKVPVMGFIFLIFSCLGISAETTSRPESCCCFHRRRSGPHKNRMNTFFLPNHLQSQTSIQTSHPSLPILFPLVMSDRNPNRDRTKPSIPIYQTNSH